MLSAIVRPLRAVVHELLAWDSPRQLAAGFALGMVLGILPKGNLIALSVCVILFSLRVNKGLAIVAAVLFSCLGPLADSFTSRMGNEVLHAGVLQAGFASLYKLPLGPWWGFNNTVVMGSLLVGLYLAYPVYWAGYAGQRWLEPNRGGWGEVKRPPSDTGGSLRSTPATHAPDSLPETRREAA